MVSRSAGTNAGPRANLESNQWEYQQKNDRTSDDQYVAYATCSVENRTHAERTDSEGWLLWRAATVYVIRDLMLVSPL